MSETMVQVIGVGLLILIAILGISKMQSPTKGSDSMGVVIEEIQKAMEPKVSQIRKMKETGNAEAKQNKKGDDKDSAA